MAECRAIPRVPLNAREFTELKSLGRVPGGGAVAAAAGSVGRYWSRLEAYEPRMEWPSSGVTRATRQLYMVTRSTSTVVLQYSASNLIDGCRLALSALRIVAQHW